MNKTFNCLIRTVLKAISKPFNNNKVRELLENLILLNCAEIAADVPPAASDDRRLYSQETFSVKNQDILNDDALHF